MPPYIRNPRITTGRPNHPCNYLPAKKIRFRFEGTLPDQSVCHSNYHIFSPSENKHMDEFLPTRKTELIESHRNTVTAPRKEINMLRTAMTIWKDLCLMIVKKGKLRDRKRRIGDREGEKKKSRKKKKMRSAERSRTRGSKDMESRAKRIKRGAMVCWVEVQRDTRHCEAYFLDKAP